MPYSFTLVEGTDERSMIVERVRAGVATGEDWSR